MNAIAALPGVRDVRAATPLKYQLDQSVPTTGATLLRGPEPGFTGSSGSGVVVGEVDSGVDYSDDDFRNPDGSTRFLDIWDQTDFGGSPPAPFGYGSEWNAAQINAQTASELDLEGHG